MYLKSTIDPTRPLALYKFINHLLGWPCTRKYIKSLTDGQRKALYEYAQFMLLEANDSIVRPRVKRPAWFPKKYMYGRVQW